VVPGLWTQGEPDPAEMQIAMAPALQLSTGTSGWCARGVGAVRSILF
jgi:hypothetical protein